MGKIRKNYSASLKAKVALEAVKKEKTISQLSSEYELLSNVVYGIRRRSDFLLPVFVKQVVA